MPPINSPKVTVLVGNRPFTVDAALASAYDQHRRDLDRNRDQGAPTGDIDSARRICEEDEKQMRASLPPTEQKRFDESIVIEGLRGER